MSINKLYIFGDSNSLPFFGNEVESEKYKKFKGGKLPKGWMEILSDKLNLDLINYAEMGLSNSTIFQTICDKIRYVQPNDMVIVGWTFKMRYQVVSEYETKENEEEFFGFSDVIPSYIPENSLLSVSAMEELLIHKNHKLWVNEIYFYEKLLVHLSNVCGFDLYFWSFDEEIGKIYNENTNMIYYLGKENLYEYYESESYKNLNLKTNNTIDFENYGFWRHLEQLGMKQICDETNGEVNDGHIDEKGHIILSDLFLYQIKKRNGIRL